MSLLDDKFNVNIEDLITHAIKKLFIDGSFFIGHLIKSLPIFNANEILNNEIPNIYIDGIDTGENEDCCIGYKYIIKNGMIKVHFKLFNPEYVSKSYKIFKYQVYTIDGYILIDNVKSYSCSHREYGWIIVNINNLVDGNLSPSHIITPSDVSEQIREEAIREGNWVL